MFRQNCSVKKLHGYWAMWCIYTTHICQSIVATGRCNIVGALTLADDLCSVALTDRDKRYVYGRAPAPIASASQVRASVNGLVMVAGDGTRS
jgi:hypothetical protein